MSAIAALTVSAHSARAAPKPHRTKIARDWTRQEKEAGGVKFHQGKYCGQSTKHNLNITSPSHEPGMVRRVSLSIVVTLRNDQHAGGSLPARASLVLWSMLETADEVVVSDMATPEGRSPLIDLLEPSVRTHANMRSVVIEPRRCARLLSCVRCCDGDSFHEAFGRNIGIAAAMGDIIVSSNIDVIPPSRHVLEHLIRAMPSWQHAFTLPRKELEMSDAAAALKNRSNDVAVCPWATSVHVRDMAGSQLAHKAVRGGMKRTAWFPAVSLIKNCGDFQMAWRGLWRRASFAMALDGKRQFADTMLQAAWLNLRVSLHAPGGAHVWHLAHERVLEKDFGSDAASRFNSKPFFKIAHVNGRPYIMNLREPEVNASGGVLTSPPVRAFAAAHSNAGYTDGLTAVERWT